MVECGEIVIKPALPQSLHRLVDLFLQFRKLLHFFICLYFEIENVDKSFAHTSRTNQREVEKRSVFINFYI